MKFVILGGGAAGLNAAKTLRKLKPSSEIVVITEDKEIYSPAMLHLYLSGARDLEGINFMGEDFFNRYNIRWISGSKIAGLDTYLKEVYLDNFTIIPFDKLLIATGSSTAAPTGVKNLENSNNIFGFYSIKDVKNIKERLKTAKSLIILGGGRIGMDIISGLLHSRTNLDIHLVEYTNNILGSHLDKRAAKPYEDYMESRGVDIHTGVLPLEVLMDENRNFEGLVLSNGQTIYSDMMIVSVGLEPNIDFLYNSDILINSGVVTVGNVLLRRGVLVNKKCETNREDIYAAGDVCAEKLSNWQLAVRQGRVAAYNMAGEEKVLKDLYGEKSSLHYFGTRTISIGEPGIQLPGIEYSVYDDGHVYKRIAHRNGKIYSVILQNELSQSGVYENLIKKEVDISNIKKDILDIKYADFFNVIESDASFSYDFNDLEEMEDKKDIVEY